MYILCSFTSSFVFGSVEPLCDLFAVAMESDIVCRIRDALHPLVFCVFPAEVYQRRDEILTDVYQCTAWESDDLRKETIDLIRGYWLLGTNPSRLYIRPLRRGFALSGLAGSVEQDAVPVETEAMRSLLAQIQAKLPEVLPHEDEPVSGDEDLCQSCNRKPAWEATFPECYGCYQEHCD